MRLWGADLATGTKGIADRPCINALARELPLPPAGEGGGEGVRTTPRRPNEVTSTTYTLTPTLPRSGRGSPESA
jgi:hypothetical protein